MVRATFSGFNTALSALQANQKRLDITGQNLSNMNTAGYTRQQLEASSLNYTNPVSHYSNGNETAVGFGVSMDRVSQIRDPYLDIQYRSQSADCSYTNRLQTALNSLSKVLDETTISGIRQAFDDIQSTLTSMQDPAKVSDPIYESELRTKMQSVCNLFNQASRQISQAEQNEFQRLTGEGSSEQGDVQKINDILRQIGDLNVQIKRNQVADHPSLELQDELLWSSFFVTLVAKKIVLINLCCRPCFIWGSITIITVWTNMIIINVCKFFYLLIECFLCCKLIQICAFILQGIEITLHRCIVVRISCFAHALCHIYRFAEFGKCFGRIL